MKPADYALSAAVEGPVDRAVLERILKDFGITLAPVHGLKGKGHLFKQRNGYNHAARFTDWTLLIDLDREASCAPDLCKRWLPDPAPLMCMQVAVHAIEAWLMADGEAFATFFKCGAARIPPDPERHHDPKRTLVELAKLSRSREIRASMVPRAGSGAAVGLAYTPTLLPYIFTKWRAEIAEGGAPSLQRYRRKLANLANRHPRR